MKNRYLSIVMAAAVCTGISARPVDTHTAIAPDGANIAYETVGPAGGVPLIVIAGGPGSDSRYMRHGGALERVARGRRVVFYDSRGTGRSADSKGDETVDLFIGDLDAVRSALNAPRVDLLGHSFGGYLAMAYTAKHPDAVRSLILVDTLPPKVSDLVSLIRQIYPDRADEWRDIFSKLGKQATNADTRIFQSMAFVDQALARRYVADIGAYRFNAEVGKSIRADMGNLDYWPQVRKFTQPTLVLHGRFDTVVSLSNSWTLHQAIAGSRIHVFEGAGHVPHVEHPDEFASVVRAFLTELDRGLPHV